MRQQTGGSNVPYRGNGESARPLGQKCPAVGTEVPGRWDRSVRVLGQPSGQGRAPLARLRPPRSAPKPSRTPGCEDPAAIVR